MTICEVTKEFAEELAQRLPNSVTFGVVEHHGCKHYFAGFCSLGEMREMCRKFEENTGCKAYELASLAFMVKASV